MAKLHITFNISKQKIIIQKEGWWSAATDCYKIYPLQHKQNVHPLDYTKLRIDMQAEEYSRQQTT